MEAVKTKKENPLGTAPLGSLLVKFAVPSIISMLVSALYNIVDQIFIGQGVGLYGNAATNVAFPLTTLATAVGLLIGIGGASNFNLELGKKHEDTAKHIAGSAFGSLIISGLVIALIARIFLRPMITAFGATPDVMDYAVTYVGITAVGMPFFVLTTGGSHLIRADGKPMFSMLSALSGAIINTILDPLFIFVFDWGIAGAAWATVIGQIFSALLVLGYLPHFHTVSLTWKDYVPKLHYVRMIAALGAAACFNQLAIFVTQITMNNVLRYYGAQSVYGSDIPLAVVGVGSKVNMVFMAIVIGISQGAQPIIGYNYGAANYHRVKKTYRIAAAAATIIAVIAFAGFQLFPRQITALFGSGDELYEQFAVSYFRIFMFMTFLNGIQPLTANFFTSIGKATTGIFISMTRQILFLIPLVLILPLIFGIEGVMFAGPVADGVAGVLAVVLVMREFKKIPDQKPETV